jgi:polar amino acid transport system substrate-binding protein
MPLLTSRFVLFAGIAVTVAASVACAPQASPTPASTSPGGAACAKDGLTTVTKGKLTIATDDPSYPPWIVDNKPETGQGFEGAVADAVATQLGFARSDVTWVRVTFNNAIAPGPKNFDFDINQFSITEERKLAVDFSSPYYDVRQTVITVKGSKIAGAKSLADLQGAKLAAQVGTTSYKAITDIIKPTVQPAVLNNNDDVKKQLENGSIDGAVVDLPTAFYITGAELDAGVIVGQLPQPPGATPEQFGLVLDKGSRLTACVSQAVDALRTAGTLKALEAKWLAETAGAPELT